MKWSWVQPCPICEATQGEPRGGWPQHVQHVAQPFGASERILGFDSSTRQGSMGGKRGIEDKRSLKESRDLSYALREIFPRGSNHLSTSLTAAMLFGLASYRPMNNGGRRLNTAVSYGEIALYILPVLPPSLNLF